MQDSIGVEIVQAEEGLVEVSQDDGLSEHAVLVEEAGDAAARHPLYEHVDVRGLLDGAVHADHVRVLEPGDKEDLLPDQTLHSVLLLVAVPAEADLLGCHQGSGLHIPGLVAGAIGPRAQDSPLGPVNTFGVLSLILTILHHLEI